MFPFRRHNRLATLEALQSELQRVEQRLNRVQRATAKKVETLRDLAANLEGNGRVVNGPDVQSHVEDVSNGLVLQLADLKHYIKEDLDSAKQNPTMRNARHC